MRYIRYGSNKKMSPAKVAILATLAITSVLGGSTFLWATFHTTAIPCVVESHEWQCNIDIERYGPVRYTRRWSVPAGAYDIHEYEEGANYIDSGGNFIMDDDTYYDYTLDEWTYTNTLSRSGIDKTPLWPITAHLRVQNTVNPEFGQQRIASRDSYFFVNLIDRVSRTKSYRAEIDRQQWEYLEKSQLVIAYVNHFDTVRWVESK